MRTTLLKTLALLAAALLCAPPLFAQTKPEPRPVKPAAPSPPVPPRVPSLAGSLMQAAPDAPRKLSLFETPICHLAEAVRHLQTQLQLNKMEPLNILVAPDTTALEVYELSLRNVTGAEALQLIAAAAGCTVEPMFSTDAPPAQPVAGAPGMSGMPSARNAPAVIGYMFHAKPKYAMPPPGMPTPMMMPAGRLASATSPTGRLTRIYPLGATTTATKFPDLEKTLREIFKADGVAEKEVSLALHEKTNVLVVNAGEQVHNLVEQLLTALNTNTSQADRLNTARDRAMGREELESAARAQRRLELELAERDAQMRDLKKELHKLQDAVQKPPSAK
jgi:hypothetical protein